MTPEELLKPRFLLTNDYPGNNREVGSISIEIHTAEYFRKYKANFRELEWWEERDVKDMPEYITGVKDYFKGKMYKIAHPSQNGREWHIDHEMEHRTFLRYASDFLPATESDYNEYIKSKA